MKQVSILKIAILTILVVFSVSRIDAGERTVKLSDQHDLIELTINSQTGFNVRMTLGGYSLNEVSAAGENYDQIFIAGFGSTPEVGEPQLPQTRRFIAVPVGAEVRLSILSRKETHLSAAEARIFNQIYPAQHPVSKSADPATIPFAKTQASYSQDRFVTKDVVSFADLGFMRGIRLGAVDFVPVSYNPVSGELKITTELELRVDFIAPDLAATQDLQARTASWEFDQLYEKSIFNWMPQDKANIVRHPTKMLILTPAAYTATLQPFITWKRQQGLTVIVTTVGSGGTVANTTTAIQSYMNGVWSAATAQDPAPTYLLIVGDTSTSGNNIIANTGTTASEHVTDLNYVRLQGTDYMPEMYYGRFSVSSATELTNIINKTLQFEQTTMPDLSYLGKTVLIAGMDNDYASTHGNGALNYATTQYFNAAQGIVSNNYLYPTSGSSGPQIIANANEGRGYMNYSAHGNETGWADPSFTTANINAMTNVNKYFVAVGNACLTNAFNYSSPCFGEAVIRAANKGGVAYIGGTNSTYWNQDYWWAVGFKNPINGIAPPYSASALGAYDAMFHTHGEAVADWAQTTGETVYMGNLAVQQAANQTYTNYYWEIYAIMGDPSLMPYYGVPSVNTASYPTQILTGSNSLSVSATPYSRVAISRDGVLHGTGIVPASGNLALSFTPFTSAGTAKLVITAQNKISKMVDISVAGQSSGILFEDGFESYTNFALTFAPWTLVDVDMSGTYGMTGITWPNAYAAMAYMIFVPSATTPPVTDAAPHGGLKMAASFAGTTPPNNDWMISPQVAGGGSVQFWAKSYTAQYGLERFKVGVSTTGTAPANFTVISGANYIQAPVDWTLYEYSLAAYAGQQIRVGIQCVSNDAFIFFVDDFKILGSVSASDPEASPALTALSGNYPNPFTAATTILYSLKENLPVTIGIYNVKGQLVRTLVNETKTVGYHSAVWDGLDSNGLAASSGVYLYRMSSGTYSSAKKMILVR